MAEDVEPIPNTTNKKDLSKSSKGSVSRKYTQDPDEIEIVQDSSENEEPVQGKQSKPLKGRKRKTSKHQESEEIIEPTNSKSAKASNNRKNASIDENTSEEEEEEVAVQEIQSISLNKSSKSRRLKPWQSTSNDLKENDKENLNTNTNVSPIEYYNQLLESERKVHKLQMKEAERKYKVHKETLSNEVEKMKERTLENERIQHIEMKALRSAVAALKAQLNDANKRYQEVKNKLDDDEEAKKHQEKMIPISQAEEVKSQMEASMKEDFQKEMLLLNDSHLKEMCDLQRDYSSTMQDLEKKFQISQTQIEDLEKKIAEDQSLFQQEKQKQEENVHSLQNELEKMTKNNSNLEEELQKAKAEIQTGSKSPDKRRATNLPSYMSPTKQRPGPPSITASISPTKQRNGNPQPSGSISPSKTGPSSLDKKLRAEIMELKAKLNRQETTLNESKIEANKLKDERDRLKSMSEAKQDSLERRIKTLEKQVEKPTHDANATEHGNSSGNSDNEVERENTHGTTTTNKKPETDDHNRTASVNKSVNLVATKPNARKTESLFKSPIRGGRQERQLLGFEAGRRNTTASKFGQSTSINFGIGNEARNNTKGNTSIFSSPSVFSTPGDNGNNRGRKAGVSFGMRPKVSSAGILGTETDSGKNTNVTRSRIFDFAKGSGSLSSSNNTNIKSGLLRESAFPTTPFISRTKSKQGDEDHENSRSQSTIGTLESVSSNTNENKNEDGNENENRHNNESLSKSTKPTSKEPISHKKDTPNNQDDHEKESNTENKETENENENETVTTTTTITSIATATATTTATTKATTAKFSSPPKIKRSLFSEPIFGTSKPLGQKDTSLPTESQRTKTGSLIISSKESTTTTTTAAAVTAATATGSIFENPKLSRQQHTTSLSLKRGQLKRSAPDNNTFSSPSSSSSSSLSTSSFNLSTTTNPIITSTSKEGGGKTQIRKTGSFAIRAGDGARAQSEDIFLQNSSRQKHKSLAPSFSSSSNSNSNSNSTSNSNSSTKNNLDIDDRPKKRTKRELVKTPMIMDLGTGGKEKEKAQ